MREGKSTLVPPSTLHRWKPEELWKQRRAFLRSFVRSFANRPSQSVVDLRRAAREAFLRQQREGRTTKKKKKKKLLVVEEERAKAKSMFLQVGSRFFFASLPGPLSAFLLPWRFRTDGRTKRRTEGRTCALLPPLPPLAQSKVCRRSDRFLGGCCSRAHLLAQVVNWWV